jgi:putative spermidine/putrescine transport system ATP-binding protein/putrescine transport system ATP-binding protein
MEHSSESVIVLQNVIKRFGSTTAVDNVTFDVAAGETVSLLGPSGCGKTTTLRLIAGFEDPDAGVIEIAGESMVGKRPYERNVGLLFQHYALFPHMTVEQNVAYGLKHRHWPKEEIGDRVSEMLRLVHLEGFGGRRPGQLSGGQQQRVALARVLATKPKLVLLDEPLSALDAKLREELGNELKQILTAVGSTTIVVTHDQEEAMSLADRIIVMNRGRIEQLGTPDDIYMRPRTAFVASFIGRTNWFNGHVTGAANDGLWRLVTKAGTVLIVKNPGLAPSTDWRVCVRPERVLIEFPRVKSRMSDRNGNLLNGEIIGVVNMGAGFHYISETPEGRVIAVESNRDGARVKKGDQVSLLIRAEDCVLLPLDSS